MSTDNELAQIDSGDAVAAAAHEAIEGLDAGDSRRGFLKKAGLAGGSMVAGGALLGALTPAGAMAAGKGRPPASFGKGDIGILNYALTLEYLEAAFYNEATANNNKKSFLKTAAEKAFLKQTTADENAHVKFLKKALGKKAVAAPKVDFGATTASRDSFIKTAVALENTGVGAYSGQALNIASPAYIAAALSIWSIEARHASVAGLLLKPIPANISPNGAFDKPKTADEVLKIVGDTGFLK